MESLLGLGALCEFFKSYFWCGFEQGVGKDEKQGCFRVSRDSLTAEKELPISSHLPRNDLWSWEVCYPYKGRA